MKVEAAETERTLGALVSGPVASFSYGLARILTWYGTDRRSIDIQEGAAQLGGLIEQFPLSAAYKKIRQPPARHPNEFEVYTPKKERKIEIDEFNGKTIIEDKSVHGLGTKHPKTGKVSNAIEWASKHIVDKTLTKVTMLEKADSTYPVLPGEKTAWPWMNLPTISELTNHKWIHFRVESSQPDVKAAVRRATRVLETWVPGWKFTYEFGYKK
jgi:hypothetical protein